MKTNITLLSVLVLIPVFLSAQPAGIQLDSTVVYEYTSPMDSMPMSKDYYKMYDDNGMVTELNRSLWNDNMWMEHEMQQFKYNESGQLTSFNSTGEGKDYQVEYDFEAGVLTLETQFKNNEDGTDLPPVWSFESRMAYNYNGSLVQQADRSVYLGYWQGIGNITHTYNGTQLTKSSENSLFPHPKVKIFETLYSETPEGFLYETLAFMVNNTASMDDLEDVMIPDDSEALTVYTNNGTNDLRYVLNDVAGKSLRMVLSGDNLTGTIIDLSQLRLNYLEWMKTPSGQTTLLNYNIKSNKTVTNPNMIVVTDNLFSENSTGRIDEITTYRIKGATTMDLLEEVTIAADKEWISVFLKDNPSEPDAPYYLMDIYDVAGKTLKELFEANSITADQLYDKYVELFIDAEGKRTLVGCNVKAMKEGDDKKVVVTENLTKSGSTSELNVSAYFVEADAVLNDLAEYTVADDVDFVNVYVQNLTSYERIDLHGVAGKTLQAIFEGDNDESTVIDISTLYSRYREWFYTQSGRIIFVNLNVKAVSKAEVFPKVEVTEDLYATGSDIQKVTAYEVRTHAILDDLEQYVLTDIDFLNVYTFDGTENVRYILRGVEGKTLKEAISGQNDESITIDITQLRDDYIEWFEDAVGRKTLVPFNIKAVESLGSAPTFPITENIYNEGSNDYIYRNSAYMVSSSATESDLESQTLADDIDWINVYTNNGTENVRYVLKGIAGKTLNLALSAEGNDEGIDIDISQLQGNYVEWFVNEMDRPQLVRLNIKAVKQLSDEERLKKTTDYTYNTEGVMETVIVTHYDNATEPQPMGDRMRTTYSYSDDQVSMKVLDKSSDGITWNEYMKMEYKYNLTGDTAYINTYMYETDYVLSTKEIFYYYDPASSISSVIDNSLQLYPNPVQNTLFIQSDTNASHQFTIYDIKGSVVLSGWSNLGEQSIDVSTLPSGMYIIIIQTESGHRNGKFVK